MAALAAAAASGPSAAAARVIEEVGSGRVKFYLLQTCGPMSYTLRDEQEAKFKVLLGDPNRCSCKSSGGRAADGGDFVPCTHVLFVLLRVLRVAADDKVCWQRGLSERDIEDVLVAQSRRRENASAAALSDGRAKRKHKFLRKRAGEGRARGGSGNQSDDDLDAADEDEEGRFDFVARKAVEADDVCPICQEELPTAEDKVDRLAYCRISCGNSLHVKCMKIWAEHQSNVGTPVSCPLCRVSWGTFALQELKRADRKARAQHKLSQRRRSTHVGAHCKVCKASPVVGPRMRCLVCPEGVDLCATCYNNRTDVECKRKRHPFLVRDFVGDEWAAAPACKVGPPGDDGAGATGSTLANSLAQALQTREITTEDYDLLLQLDKPLADPNAVQAGSFADLLVKYMRVPSSSAADSACGVCSTILGAQSARRVLGCCNQVVHESCAHDLAASTDEALCCAVSDPQDERKNEQLEQHQDNDDLEQQQQQQQQQQTGNALRRAQGQCSLCAGLLFPGLRVAPPTRKKQSDHAAFPPVTAASNQHNVGSDFVLFSGVAGVGVAAGGLGTAAGQRPGTSASTSSAASVGSLASTPSLSSTTSLSSDGGSHWTARGGSASFGGAAARQRRTPHLRVGAREEDGSVPETTPHFAGAMLGRRPLPKLRSKAASRDAPANAFGRSALALPRGESKRWQPRGTQDRVETHERRKTQFIAAGKSRLVSSLPPPSQQPPADPGLSLSGLKL